MARNSNSVGNPQASILEEQAFVALMRTADMLQRRAAEMLKQFGLSPTQYNALRILRGAGANGLPCSEVAARMITRDPDITRLMDRLQRHRWIERTRDPGDRRVIKVRLCSAGLDLLKRLDPRVERFQQRILGHLGQQRLQVLIDLLMAAREPAS